MIIPPDPEKDPNTLSPSSSTPSLLPPPTESTTSIRHPELAHRNPAFGYPFGDEHAFTGEALPPYEGRRGRRMREGEVFRDPSGITPPPRPVSPSSNLDEISPVNTHAAPTSQLPPTSASKLWESTTSFPPRRRHSPRLPALPLSPRVRKWWKRNRRYIQAALVFLLIGIGVMIGLLVAFKKGLWSHPAQPGTGMQDGRRTTSWEMTGESLNLTYVASRDGPSTSEVNLTQCNDFLPLNTSNPFTLLTTPYLSSHLSVATFTFPLANSSSLPFSMMDTYSLMGDFAINATGLGASGTLEIVGSDSPDSVVGSGTEGVLQVDVVVQYSGSQQVGEIMKVGRMVRRNGAVGVGIYTPTQTDGKVSNAYAINPVFLPSIHVIVRFPPSAFSNSTRPSIYLPSMTFNLDRMGVRFGNLQNIVEFGNLTLTSGRGGMVADYVTAKNVDVITSQNSVRGRWNISESISVNNTAGSILSEIILHDPATTETTEVLLSPDLAERDGLSAWSGLLSAAKLRPTHSIATSFFTSAGLVSVAYLHHPTRTALSSIITTGGGEVDIHLHPNYVGPFMIQNLWGDVRLPPKRMSSSADPQGWGRTRSVVLGEVDVPEDSLFAGAGRPDTGAQISGAAYWSGGQVQLTATSVQEGDEGRGSELMVLGSWGDVRVTFDGT